MSYDYDRRVANASATPTLDALAHDAAKVVAKLEVGIKKLHPAADKIEKLQRSGSEGPALQAATDAASAAYQVFAPFRPFLSNATRELSELKGMSLPVAKEAHTLYNILRSFDHSYALTMDAAHKKNVAEAVKSVHDLAVGVSSLKTIFGQFVSAYGH